MLVEYASLTPSERLTLHRRRADRSQEDEARKRRVTLYLYRRWERGTSPNVPKVTLSPRSLAPHEECYVLRRRARLRQRDIAKRIGVCRSWINYMELGRIPPAPLIAYWARRAA